MSVLPLSSKFLVRALAQSIVVLTLTRLLYRFALQSSGMQRGIMVRRIDGHLSEELLRGFWENTNACTLPFLPAISTPPRWHARYNGNFKAWNPLELRKISTVRTLSESGKCVCIVEQSTTLRIRATVLKFLNFQFFRCYTKADVKFPYCG